MNIKALSLALLLSISAAHTITANALSLAQSSIQSINFSQRDLDTGLLVPFDLKSYDEKTMLSAQEYVYTNAISAIDSYNFNLGRTAFDLQRLKIVTPNPVDWDVRNVSNIYTGVAGGADLDSYANVPYSYEASNAERSFNFTVSPRSSVIFTATIKAYAGGEGAPVIPQSTSAAAGGLVIVTSDIDYQGRVFSVLATATPQLYDNYSFRDQFSTLDIFYEYTNTTYNPMNAHFSWQMYTNIQNAALTVPELPSVGMLVTGLALIGTVVRRRDTRAKRKPQ